jgi:hypothetical protein
VRELEKLGVPLSGLKLHCAPDGSGPQESVTVGVVVFESGITVMTVELESP